MQLRLGASGQQVEDGCGGGPPALCLPLIPKRLFVITAFRVWLQAQLLDQLRYSRAKRCLILQCRAAGAAGGGEERRRRRRQWGGGGDGTLSRHQQRDPALLLPAYLTCVTSGITVEHVQSAQRERGRSWQCGLALGPALGRFRECQSQQIAAMAVQESSLCDGMLAAKRTSMAFHRECKTLAALLGEPLLASTWLPLRTV
jgi:hypothetical protein